MMHTNSVRTIGRSALWSMLNQSAGQILALVVFLITARFVGKDDFGVMAVCMVTIEFFRQVMIESVGISLAAKQNPVKEDYNAGFFLIIAGSLLSAGIMFLLAHPISVFLKDPDIEHALQITCLVLLAMGLSRTHETWMTKNMQFRILAIRSIIAYLVGGAVGIYMAVHGYGLWSLITQQILISMLSVALLWASSSWRPDFRFKKENAKPLFGYSKHIALNALTGFLGSQGDTFFASYYLGSTATGVYNASKRILLAIHLMITSGLNYVALPVFAACADNAENLKNSYLKATRYTMFVTAPLYIGLLFLSKDIVQVVLGSKWADVAPVLSILCAATFITTIDQYNTNIRLVMGKPHWQTFITVLNTVTNIVLLIALARYGLHAIALTLTLKTLSLYPVSLYLSLKLMKVKIGEYFNEIFAILVSALFMGGMVHEIQKLLPDLHALLNIMILVPMGCLIYLCAFFVIDRKMLMEIKETAFQLIRRA
jgi:O-antigen/teichoic acid export membrane protein